MLNFPVLLAHPVGDAVALGAISLVIVFLTPAPINRIVPAPLIALGSGTLLALFLFSGAPILAHVPTGLPSLQVPTLTVKDFPDIVGSALVLALVRVALSADLADRRQCHAHQP
jgi:SulP family sulfate permease